MGVRIVLLTALLANSALRQVSSRAVNISNTWMLPEEGFPVFYRYFRDRISWYEADAVCQFHHANLVTVDSTSQYDAIRAYLKELDITNNVWIGLSRSPDKPNFAWSDFRPLSSEGYWQEAIPAGSDPLCAAMDPAADFWWKALPCGGPTVASFICELPVPSWAMGPGGCLLTELPSLTVLYNPEQSALELTSDCGLDGTKRIACKGNADREEIMRQLTCTITGDDFDEKSTKPPTATSIAADRDDSVKTTKPWIWTSNTVDVEYGTPTRHRRETEDTPDPHSMKATTEVSRLEASTTAKPFAAIVEKTMEDVMKVASIVEEKSQKLTLPIKKVISELSVDQPSLETTFSSIPVEKTKETSKKVVIARTTAAPLRESFSKPTSNKLLKATSSVHDVTLESSLKVDKEKSRLPSEPTTEVVNPKPEEQAESFGTASATTEAKVGEFQQEEYPSAISQGQLFSIIENGTMFDIIELNETSGDDAKLRKEFTLATSQQTMPSTMKKISESTSAPTQSTSAKPPDVLYTTVIYHKEPPQEAPLVTNEAMKKANNSTVIDKNATAANVSLPKKDMHKEKNVNDLSTKADDKSLSKEVEMIPIAPDSLIKLNRTNRKELPMLDDGRDKPARLVNRIREEAKMFNAEMAEMNQHVEITLHQDDNQPITSFLVTTKRTFTVDNNSKNLTEPPKFEKLQGTHELGDEANVPNVLIDPKIEDLNTNLSESNDSEKYIPPTSVIPERIQYPVESELMKEQFLPKSLLGESQEMERSESSSHTPTIEEPTEPEPQEQPRPNRKRQLTRPAQSRSFYPYFFSRVLG